MRHRAPGLTAVYNEIKSSSKNRILDLGPMVAANFNFFSKLSCKVHFENFNDFIQEPDHNRASGFAAELDNYLLNHAPNEKFEVILTWDILNYLSLDEIGALFLKLNNWCHPNTLMHAIRYLGKNIPPQPARFQIIDQYHVELTVTNLAPRKIPNHQTAQLLKKLPDYYLHNNLMNENGMLRGISEQVMRFQPDVSQRKQFIASTEITTSAPLKSALKNSKDKIVEDNTFYSPSLEWLLKQVTPESKILDLGSKSSHNMDFWRSRFNEVYTEDLASSLRWRNYTQRADKVAQPSGISDQALRFKNNLVFDAVVFWDSLNFCDIHQLRAIGERLEAHCHNGTKLIVLSYLGNKIPEYPLKFTITAANRYRVQEVRKVDRETPALTTSAIMKLIPGWRICGTHLFSTGMRQGLVELIFEQTREPDNHRMSDGTSTSRNIPGSSSS